MHESVDTYIANPPLDFCYTEAAGITSKMQRASNTRGVENSQPIHLVDLFATIVGGCVRHTFKNKVDIYVLSEPGGTSKRFAARIAECATTLYSRLFCGAASNF